MKDFDSGFTDRSYFNIFKQIVVGIYRDATEDGKLNFKYRDAKEINAFADYNGVLGEDILVVNVDTVVEIFAMMKTAYAQNDILDKIAFSMKEKNKIIDGKFIPYNCSIMYDGESVNPVRNLLAEYTALMALRFIASHELGHILNGHTKLMNSMYMNSKIEMRLEKIIHNKKYCLDRRTLEMDADAAAATRTINNVIMLYCEHRDDYIFKLLTKPEDIFSIWGFAISCIFFKLESLGETQYEEDACYLPNFARLIMVIDSAYQTAKTYIAHNVVEGLLDNKDNINKAILYGIEHAQFFCRKIYYRDFRWIESVDNEVYRAFSEEVLDNWNNRLFHKLTPYSRAPLYLPSEIDETIEQLKRGW